MNPAKRRTPRSLVRAALLCALAGPLAAQASPVSIFGAGAGSISSAGGGLAMPRDGSIVFTNPAALVRLPGENGVLLGYALVRSHFEEFPELYWDTNRDGQIDDDDTPLDLQPAYETGDGLHLALHRRVGRRFALGAALFWPKDRIIKLSTFEPELPNYFMFDSRMQRYGLAVGFGWEQIRGLSLGGGVRIIPQARYDISATIDASFQGAEEGVDDPNELVSEVTVDVHEMSLDLITDFIPVVSFHWDVGQLIPHMQWLQLAGSWHGSGGLPVDVDGDLQVNAAITDVGSLDDILMPVLVRTQLGVYDHYLPAQLCFGASVQPFEFMTVFVDAQRTYWEAMEINVTEVVYAHVESPLFTVHDEDISEGNPMDFTWRNTWAFRVGGELALPRWDVNNPLQYVQVRLRGGGGIEPSPLVEQSELTAILDSDRLVLGGGLQVEHRDPFNLAQVTRWSVFGQLHLLADGEFQRRDPGVPTGGHPVEVGSDGYTSIPVGGRVWTLGGQLELDY